MANAALETGLDMRRQQALRHSKSVRRYRHFLPILAAILIAISAVFVWLQKTVSVDIAFDSAGLKDGRLVMNNPQVEGNTPDGGFFEVKADTATQDPSIPKIIDLEGVLANVPAIDGALGMLTALKGRYNSALQTLQLEENIFFETEDGSSITMKSAQVNMSEGWLSTEEEVSLVYQGGTLNAGSMEVLNRGETVRFSNGVSLTVPPSMLADTAPEENP